MSGEHKAGSAEWLLWKSKEVRLSLTETEEQHLDLPPWVWDAPAEVGSSGLKKLCFRNSEKHGSWRMWQILVSPVVSTVLCPMSSYLPDSVTCANSGPVCFHFCAVIHVTYCALPWLLKSWGSDQYSPSLANRWAIQGCIFWTNLTPSSIHLSYLPSIMLRFLSFLCQHAIIQPFLRNCASLLEEHSGIQANR